MASRMIKWPHKWSRFHPKSPAPDPVFVGSLIFLAIQIPRLIYDMTTEIYDANKRKTVRSIETGRK